MQSLVLNKPRYGRWKERTASVFQSRREGLISNQLVREWKNCYVFIIILPFFQHTSAMDFFSPEKNPPLAHKPPWLLYRFSLPFIAQFWGRAHAPSSVCFLPFSTERAPAGLCPTKATVVKVPSHLHGATSDPQFSSLFLDLSIALGTVDHFLFVTWLFPFPLGTPHSLIFLLSLAASFVSPVFFLLAPKFPPFAQDAQGWSLVLLTSADLSSLLATYRVMPPTFRSLAKTCPPNSTLYDQLPSWTCISSLQLLLFLPKLAIHMTSHFSKYNFIPLVAALA